MQMIAQPIHKKSLFVLVIALAMLVSACSSTPPQGHDRDVARRAIPPKPSVGQKAAAIALQQVGVPYRFGGSGPGGFDCSGLVQYSYSRAGKRVPRTTGQLWSATHPVANGDMRVGDVLFFNIEGKMSHVGLYLGDDRFVHAPSTGRKVTVGSLDTPYYRTALIRAGRPR